MRAERITVNGKTYEMRLMAEHAPAIFVALQELGAGGGDPAIDLGVHGGQCRPIVSLVVFAGAVAAMDLRMAGLSRDAGRRGVAQDASGDDRRLHRPVITGVALFAAEAGHVIMNPVFQFKLALIALGL